MISRRCFASIDADYDRQNDGQDFTSVRRPQPSRLEQLSMCLSLPISVVSLARAYHMIANDQIVCLCFSNGARNEEKAKKRAPEKGTGEAEFG